MNLELWNRIANRMTPTRVRMERAGFHFKRIEVEEDRFDCGYGYNYFMRGEFVCVCGKLECFRVMLNLGSGHTSREEDMLDPALFLYRHGSFSLNHLLADGYSREQAEDIVAKFNGDERGSDTGRQREEQAQGVLSGARAFHMGVLAGADRHGGERHS